MRLTRLIGGSPVLAVAAALAGLCPCAQGQSLKPDWPAGSPHPFRDSLQPDAGFSFSFDGKRVGPALGPEWQVTSGAETRFRHASGLTVVRRVRAFPEFEALEYTLTFRNEGQSTLPAIANVNAMDLRFGGGLVQGASVVTSGGGSADAVYPPRDFALTRSFFGPMTPLNGQVTLDTDEGFSSKTHLPFFFVENQGRKTGIFAAVAWTGSWKASIQADFGSQTIRLQGGMADLDIQLAPGEEIAGPGILVGCYRGELADGSNRLRRLIRDRYAPKVGGKRLEPPVLYTTWFDIAAELDEKLFRTLVGNAADLGVEVFLMDAGWYKGTVSRPQSDRPGTWDAISQSLGNWELGEELSRFPSGLRSLADAVRARGMKFGLWFEPERVGPQSHLSTTHPDWVVFIPGRKWGMANFGIPAVQEYFCKVLDRYIRETGVGYLRWDQNSVLNRYWQAADPPGRRGIAEIRHLEGMHKVEEWLLERHPEMIFESCASGGNRIDLATLARRHTAWISDQTMDPHIVRFHLEGLNHFLPGNGQMVAFSPPTATYQQPGFTFPDLAYQSAFGGAFGVHGRLHEWTPAMRRQAVRHIGIFKQLRRFVAEDFYLLGTQPRDLESWSGWQFHDPQTDAGFVQAFRLRSKEGSKRFPLRGTGAKNSYRFTDPYSGSTFDVQGSKLLSEGLVFDLPEMTSRVLMYEKTRQGQ